MDKECKIIQDLIPLYSEKVASEESEKFIENHCANCNECKKILEYAQNSFNEEKNSEEKSKKIWGIIQQQEKSKNRKKWIIRGVSLFLIICVCFCGYSFLLRGNTWFTQVDYNVAVNYPLTDGQYSNFTKKEPPSQLSVKEAANEIKRMFKNNFIGCILIDLTYNEELTFSTYDNELGDYLDRGEEIVFTSSYRVITGDGSVAPGDTVSYWNWYVKYDYYYNTWRVSHYGVG